ncbi:MAG: ribose transport system ATP-binding protein [Thermotogaceae bacterium]|jgi:ribose transport system ATP-binding protein|nr:ribose transport system ATP-binding protein [Thermotogaceae bacterium]
MLLEMKTITKSFPGVLALDRVSFALEKGEVHALLGENGAGKSTLIKVLGGVYQPDSGEILLNGERVSFPTPHTSQQKGIAIIHQELMLADNLTIAENIFLGKEPGNAFDTKYKVMLKQSKKYLEMLDFDVDPGQKVGDLNVSEKQLVVICKALAYSSKIIVMDEPTATITQHEVGKLFEIIRNLSGKGISVIFITHRLSEVYQIADTVTVLRDGHYIGTEPVGNMNENKLVKMMVGREIENMYPKYNEPQEKVIFQVKNINVDGLKGSVSFDVRRGEIYGITGLVGSGKSELALGLFGARANSFEEMEINGHKIQSITSPSDALKNGISIVPEDRKSQGLILPFDITTNLALPNVKNFGSFFNVLWKRIKKRAVDEIKRFNIKTPSENQLVKNLSGGNQQKVVLAKFLMQKPEIVIFVEPTRGIDVGAKIEVYNLINDLANQGIGVILISSEIPEIVSLCDRAMVMHRGEKVFVLDRTELTPENILKAGTGLVENE